MSYSTVSHVAHESYPSPQGYPGVAPPPPPRPGFEQGYASGPGLGPGPGPGPGPGYQSYFSDNYPPQVSHMHYSGPTRPFQQPYGGYHSHDNGLSSLLRAAMAALCCCCFLEQCCNFW